MFALPAIEHIQEVLKDNPDVLLFDLKVSPYAGRKQYAVSPGREQTSFMPIHLSGKLRRAWTDKDEAAVGELTTIACALTQQQILALGTHQSKSGTIDAIEYNVYVQFVRRLFAEIDEIQHAGRSHSLIKPENPSLDLVLGEVTKKARSNRLGYAAARGVLQKVAEQGNECAELALREVFDHEDSIWMADVARWEGAQKILKRLTTYIETLRSICAIRSTADTAAIDRTAAIRGARKIKEEIAVDLPKLPAHSTEPYAWDDLRRAAVAVIDSLPSENDSEFRKDYHDRTEQFRTLL
jgi:hypothetical protein